MQKRIRLHPVVRLSAVLLAVFLFAQQTNAQTLFFSKRVQACGKPDFLKQYAFTLRPTVGGSPTGTIHCDFTLSYNAASAPDSIALDFKPLAGSIVEANGTAHDFPGKACTFHVTAEGLVSDSATFMDEQTKILLMVLGPLFIDLKADPLTKDASGLKVGSVAEATAGNFSSLLLEKAQVTAVDGDTMALQFTKGDHPPAPDSPRGRMMGVMSAPYVGAAKINQSTGLVESCDLALTIDMEGTLIVNSFSVVEIPVGSPPSIPPATGK